MVRFASGWSTPVDPKTGAAEPGSWLARFSLEKEKTPGHPVVVIALSGVGMPRPAKRGEPVPVNEETVQTGVLTLEKFVEALKAKGADEVFVSTYHYFDVTVNQGWRQQYDNGFTRKVFDAFNQKTGRRLGIDCLTLTEKYHPLTVGDDQFHPSKAGHVVYSHCCFEALFKHDGREVPAWSLAEMESALEKERQDRRAKK